MQVKYTTPTGRLSFEFEVSSGKQAFETVAKIQELFEEPDCWACKSKNIVCSCQTHNENTYYKLACSDCGAQVDFGQRKDGKGMWIKRTDKDRQPMRNRGWYVWNGQSKAADTTTTPGYKQQDQQEESVPF